ncbi:hypothetical protein COY61_00150 [bacterium (Candidatus Gribaldobacteria) CG_4_10_14_0_8_um_filter_33_9]|uniref:Uncharacterized protein n=1 Tax=bacterium (Candidatus Gribaldobacteria) CG_4_10_14_0_8_um_filter_33_9 TaxID=2014266 RepID=A0A2M7RPJ3_9BACT|nr:MAG: hypothetical protein COY61_00150 [bacterium (Candidatus Gribaldobacteria) CG_4_10_14_0_8_um_filter_33_9]
MFNLVAEIILMASIAGMAALVVRKIPVLKNLPINSVVFEKEKTEKFLIFKEFKEKILKGAKEKVKKFYSFFLNNFFIKLKKEKEQDPKEKTKLSGNYWQRIKRGLKIQK